jgi:two-component system chemotaxis response regulator CheB
LSFDDDMLVVGEAASGEQALELLMVVKPDLILMDILMPGIDGLKTTERIMELRPTPVLIISSVVGRSVGLNFKALQAGALDIIAKPNESQFRSESLRKRFLRHIRLLNDVPVVTRRGASVSRRDRRPTVEPEKVTFVRRHIRLLAVGASTGGPPALQVLLSSLGPDVPFPVLIVQHMSTGFIGALADWLLHTTGRHVVLAEHGIQPIPGNIYLAPDHCHMKFQDNSIVLSDDEQLRAHCPSVDVLFESIAEDKIAANTVAVILTGMGSDGAIGLEQIRRSGGWSIAQDKSSSVVFGMPQAAIERYAVDEVVPLDRIAEHIKAISIVKARSAATSAAKIDMGE